MFLLSAFGLTLLWGRQLERLFVGFLVACSLATIATQAAIGINRTFYLVNILDLTILGVALVIVARSDAFWPLWFTGFHLITVSSTLAYAIARDDIPGWYGNLAGFWAIPALLALVIGSWLDHRARARD